MTDKNSNFAHLRIQKKLEHGTILYNWKTTDRIEACFYLKDRPKREENPTSIYVE